MSQNQIILTNHAAHQSPPNHYFGTVFFNTIRSYLIIGLAIASALTVSLPTDAIPTTIGKYPHLAYIIAAIVSIPIYICEGEEIPITYSLLALGLAKGPAFTFLLGAVGTCIPTLLLQKNLGKKTMIVYGIFWALFEPTAGVVFSQIIS